MAHGSGGRGRGPGGMMGFQDKTKSRSTKHLLGKLWNYLKKFKFTLILISIIVIINSLFSVASPIIIGAALDLADVSTSLDLINSVILLFIVLSISTWLFQSLNAWITATIRAWLVHDIRADVFDHLVDADMSYHHTQESGDITSRVVNDTEELATGIAVVTTASSQMLLVVATFLVLLSIDIVFALISLIAIPVAALLVAVIGSLGKRTMLKVRQAYGRVSGKLAESLAGVSISKAFNREERTSKEIRSLNYETYNYMKQLGVIFMLIFPSVTMISTFMIALTLLTGGTLNISVGTLYIGIMMVQQFLRPVIHLASYFTQLQASLAAMDRLTDVLEFKPAIADKAGADPLTVKDPSITFQNVSFSYVKDVKVINDISFKIEAGNKVAIVGHTGAGKTTITALLMRFYDPQEGQIIIGDQNLKDVTSTSIHNKLSLIPQEPYLFADTVLENIRYGKPSATDEEIYELSKLIGADDFIDALPNGYKTVLQESGKSLSAGQRQMITIARTMLSDPNILILDEATSRLDAYSESLVQFAQNILFKGRTTIVIAHRLSTIRDVNKIIVMENGELVEHGTHDELLEKGGKYFDLYRTYYAHQGVKSAEELLKEGLVAEEMVESSEQAPEIPAHVMMMMKKHGMHGKMDKKKMEEMMKKRRASGH
ncbi:MAG: ABC transporter ATP-binding protein [Candidatus Hodarchaeales archaeon]|jgi:ATP-binding cassette subfamily B protein